MDGAIAGEEAAKYAGCNPLNTVTKDALDQYEDLLNSPFRMREGISPYEIRRAIHKVMDKGMAILRNGESLESALEELSAVEEQFKNIGISDQERA